MDPFAPIESERDIYDDDPFTFDVPPAPIDPDSIPHFDWGELYKWAPSLRSVEKDGHTTFVGRKSDIAQAVIYHMGRPLCLENHAFMLPVYNRGDKKIVLKCSRQVSKTTTVAVLQTVNSILRPYWHSLYVSPSAMQTRQYSNEKFNPTIYESPFITKYFVDRTCINQVFEKTFKNGSYAFLRYAFLTPARARGIPASDLFFDEVQDLLKDNIKIISQSLSASRLASGIAGSELLAGTPLTFSNTLEAYWRWSTQNEWLVPCDCGAGGGRYWNQLGKENIAKTGLICAKCNKPLNPAAGQWVSYAPDEPYQGYHITQLMVPWKQITEAWTDEIYYPMEKWPDSKFHNEILGVSFDSASAPVTRLDIERCCYPSKKVGVYSSEQFVVQRPPAFGSWRIYAGIDWGEGRAEGEVIKGRKHHASWTVLTLGCYVSPDLFWAFYMKRYTGKDIDPEVIVPDVLNICGRFNVETIGADWGHGWGVNSRLMKAYGDRTRVMQFNYSTGLGERKRWDDNAFKYIINRNAVLSDFFATIKQGKIAFPAWSTFEPFGKDILAEYVEYNERTRTMMYDHPIDQPDDALHSLVYCKLAADVKLGRF